MLVYNSFEAYVTDTVKASFKRENTDLAVIPGGLPSLLQPLDVSLNKSVEDGVWNERWYSRIYRHWTTKEGFGGTDLFVDFARVESYSVRNDRCLFPEVRDHKQFGWIT